MSSINSVMPSSIAQFIHTIHNKEYLIPFMTLCSLLLYVHLQQLH